jgi:hypothetical protein
MRARAFAIGFSAAMTLVASFPAHADDMTVSNWVSRGWDVTAGGLWKGYVMFGKGRVGDRYKTLASCMIDRNRHSDSLGVSRQTPLKSCTCKIAGKDVGNMSENEIGTWMDECRKNPAKP